jgi:hypothetical protein
MMQAITPRAKDERLVSKAIFAAFALVAFTTASFAQVPRGNIFIGYSYLSADTNTSSRPNVHGWNGSIEGRVLPFVGVVADFSRHYATQLTCAATPPATCPAVLNGRLDSYVFGPQVSASVGGVRPFAHALFGAAHTNANGTSGASLSDTSFATALGGGADFRLAPFLGWRMQADFLLTRFLRSTQNNVRVSTGIVLRF